MKRLSFRSGAFAAASIAGTALLVGGIGITTASAATSPSPLSVTLSASNDGASAIWSSAGQPVLTLGSDSSSTYAEMTVSDPPAQAPANAPSFTTDNYAAGSPRWVINFANGYWIIGYPAQAGVTGGWEADGPGGYYKYGVTYSAALGDVGASHSTVTSAYIVADGDQAAGTVDHLSGVQYNGQSLSAGTYSAKGEIKNVNSGKCLDVVAGAYKNGGLLQQWTCGASYGGVAGADQKFQYVTFSDGTGYLEAVSGTKAFYVTTTAGAANAQLTLSSSVSAAAIMKKSGPYYTFPDTGLVMDVKGASTSDGAPVIGYANHDAINQQWSLP